MISCFSRARSEAAARNQSFIPAEYTMDHGLKPHKNPYRDSLIIFDSIIDYYASSLLTNAVIVLKSQKEWFFNF